MDIIYIILLMFFIGQGIYFNDKLKRTNERIDYLSNLLSNTHGDINKKYLKDLNISDEDIEKILTLVKNDKKLEAIKLLNKNYGIEHMKALDIISKLPMKSWLMIKIGK